MFTHIGELITVSALSVPFTNRARSPGVGPAVKVTVLPVCVLRLPSVLLVIDHENVVPVGQAPPEQIGVAVNDTLALG